MLIRQSIAGYSRDVLLIADLSKSKNRAPTLSVDARFFLFYLFYDTEQYIEHEFRFICTPTLDSIIESENALNRARSVKFYVLTKFDKEYKIETSNKLNRGIKMSTKERYGTAVWEAIADLTQHDVGFSHVWVSAGEVAKKAGVSRNTAKKYLCALWEMGDVNCAVIDGVTGFRAKVVRGY